MRKHLFATLTFAFFVTLGAFLAAGSAQAADAGNMGIPQEMLDQFAKEPPFTQADIDAYIKLVPELAKNQANPQAMQEIVEKSSLGANRLGLLGMKLGLGMMIAQVGADNPMVQEQMKQYPEVVRPTPAEVELIKKNLQPLMQAAMSAMAGAN